MPETIPRIAAAAQAKVDFYDDLRGHPSEWTEIDYAEAAAALTAADAWDLSNGVISVAVDDRLRDRLADALQGSPGTPTRTILDAILAALAPEDPADD